MAGLLSAEDFAPSRADATPVDVVSQKEADLRQQTGSTASGAAAPTAMVIDTQAPGSLKPAPKRGGLLTAQDLAGQVQAQADASPDPNEHSDFESQMGESSPATPHEAGVVAKGLVKGVASPLTAPADISIGAVNLVKRLLGMSDATLNTNASDLLDKGLVKAGFPESKGTGDEALDMAAGIAGGTLGTGGAGKLGSKAMADNSFWSSAGGNGGQNKAITNALWANKIGENGATKLTPTVLAAADDRIGAVLDSTRSPNHIYLASPEEIHSKIGAINGDLTPVNNAVLNNNTVQKLLNTFAGGHATAEDLGNISSQLGKAAKVTAKSDYETHAGLLQVKDYVEGLIQEGLEPGQAAPYAAARQQYSALQKVAKFVNPGNGDLNGAGLGKYLQRTESQAYTYGRNSEPAYEVLRRAQGVAGAKTVMNALPSAVKAAAQSVPGGAQMLVQRGLQPGLRLLVNKPGFMTALSSELDRSEGQGEDDGSQ